MESKRHFMALGAGPVGHPAMPNFQLPNRQLLNPQAKPIGGSFVVTQPQLKAFKQQKFPDIFTTCPELRSFKFGNIATQLSPSASQDKLSQALTPAVKGTFDPSSNVINPYVFLMTDYRILLGFVRHFSCYSLLN